VVGRSPCKGNPGMDWQEAVRRLLENSVRRTSSCKGLSAGRGARAERPLIRLDTWKQRQLSGLPPSTLEGGGPIWSSRE
jgi:hypothetical protein